jgi:plastocyanin
MELMLRYTRAGHASAGLGSIQQSRPLQVATGIKRGLIAAGFIVGLAATGCGASPQARTHPTATGHSPAVASAATASSAPVKVVATNSVAIKNFAFSPPTIMVKPGTRVTWVNHDEDAHTVTFTSSLKVASSPLQGNQSFSYTFQTPGTYTYICSIHPYMHGTVIVTNA